MRTSPTIKYNQLNPPTVLEMGTRRAIVEGRSRDRYKVTRPKDDPRRFVCGCKAGRAGLLCRHVQAYVRALAEGRGWDLVQFWNHEHEAKRQKRCTVELQTRDRSFWVTYARRPIRQIWNAKCPPIWESVDLYDDGTTRIFAVHDGQWKYWANRAHGIYRPAHGKSFLRGGWGQEPSFGEFKEWFKEVTV